MPLFQIQDEDRPVFVIAKDWQRAIARWRKLLNEEDDAGGDYSDEQPKGVALIADDDDVLIADTED